MKFLITIFAIFCLVAVASATPPNEESNFVHGSLALKQLEPELHNRYKRATCDLFSGLGVNHSACAAHCLLRGNRGGYCNGRGVCVCRN
ncbi:defensin Lucifensin-like [Musca vetustissima]|uniref:defensin Lucifensin-like n=1 Tax=Musca vetustissima TaxID=27455 RepID=UPI002AB6394A|nr:defensin Lucifensin-like [Musca vetustissima]